MVTPELSNFIQQQRKAGIPDEKISIALQQAGWPAQHILQAMIGGAALPPPPPPPPPSLPPAPIPGQVPMTGQPPQAFPAMPFPNPLADFKIPAMNEKTRGIIITVAVYNVIGTAISDGGRFVAQFFLGGAAGRFDQFSHALYQTGYASGYSRFWLMSPSHFVSDLVYSAIGGAIMGYVASSWWLPLRQYANQFSGGRLNSPFKVLFYPTLAASLAGILQGYLFGIIPTIIMIASSIAGRYVFAKGASVALGE